MIAALVVRVAAADPPVLPAVLRGTIVDAATGVPTPCTVMLTEADGTVVWERASFRAGFRCAGHFTKQLPAGRTRLRVSRGFETQAVETNLDLAAGQTIDVRLALRRVVELRRRGWYAGDSHVHMLHGERQIPVDFDYVALTARAEDLHYLSLAQAWTLAAPTPEALAAELRPRSTPDGWLSWNLEAPKNYYRCDAGRCLGHCWSLGLRGRTPEGGDVIQALLAASAWDYEASKPSYANFESHHLIHAQGGAVFYSHPARWWMGPWGGRGGYPRRERMRVSNMAAELPLDTLLGPTYDGLDLITGPGEDAANAKAFALWALLLNHGYRVAGTASSDACFDRPGGAVPGVPRTYTFLPDGFSWSNVARATAAGRTFVTTGPLLLTTLAGAPPGSAFPADGRERALKIEAWASGAAAGGLERIEVLRNGEAWRAFFLPGSPLLLRTNVSLKEQATAWYCVRVFGQGQPRQAAISGAFYFQDRTYRPPAPTPARVHALIRDAQTGAPLAGTLTEMVYDGTLAHPGQRRRFTAGEASVTIPGTVRLRADVPGYLPLTRSPFLDDPPLVQAVTTLQAPDLLRWQTFDHLKELLARVELEFSLRRAP